MATVNRAAAFMRFAAEKRRVRGARGAVVSLARWHAPMAGKAHSLAPPPLRNRFDVRAWAQDAGQAALPQAVGDFTREAERLWGEFCAALEADGCGPEAVAAARSLVELDADARREAEAGRVILAWADAFRCDVVTAAALCEIVECRQAIGAAMHPPRPQDEVTPSMASVVVREIAARGWGCDGWRIESAAPDRHRKVARWRIDQP